MNKKVQIYLPIIISVFFVLGILVGTRLSSGYKKKSPVFLRLTDMGFNKMNEIINYIEQEYVDTVNRSQLIDKTINSLLQELDPHSYYISSNEFAEINEPLEGSFEGIGVEFTIQDDTVLIISPIAGGPSEAVGLKAGDRIVEVEGENIAGVGITNKKIMKLLKGQGGSQVRVGILRNGQAVKQYVITRGKIPLYSLDAAYMIDSITGFIKLSRFSRTTYTEFMEGALKLKQQGMKRLILDLRNNGGGYLEEAVKLADEFLEKGNTIVFTEGKARPKKYYRATTAGEFENTQIRILVDESTASASEIISGAVQDNDRGIILGRRTYGKGLVQEQSNWPDGSGLRLTIARYYTPTGRSIQKPYDHGSKNYHLEQYGRFGKLEVAIDTLTYPDSLKFYTKNGKMVLGGGGIYPDIFVPIDTLYRTNYLIEMFYTGIIRDFALQLVDKQRDNLLKKYEDFYTFKNKYSVSSSVFNDLIIYAQQKGIKKNQREITLSKKLIENYLKANISKYLYGNNGFYSVYNTQDEAVLKAIEVKD